MTPIERAHERENEAKRNAKRNQAEQSQRGTVRAAWAAIWASGWDDSVVLRSDGCPTKQQWAADYARRLTEFAEAVRKAGLSDRIDLMRQSVADDGEQVAWELVELVFAKNARGLAAAIRKLPRSCLWGGTFSRDLPDSFFTGVIEPSRSINPPPKTSSPL